MSAGTLKLKQLKMVSKVEFAKRTNLKLIKIHINGVTTRGKIVMTPHGFILDDDKALKSYKEEHKEAWKKNYFRWW